MYCEGNSVCALQLFLIITWFIHTLDSVNLSSKHRAMFVTSLCSNPKFTVISFSLLVKFTGIHTAFLINEGKNSFDLRRKVISVRQSFTLYLLLFVL